MASSPSCALWRTPTTPPELYRVGTNPRSGPSGAATFDTAPFGRRASARSTLRGWTPTSERAHSGTARTPRHALGARRRAGLVGRLPPLVSSRGGVAPSDSPDV